MVCAAGSRLFEKMDDEIGCEKGSKVSKSARFLLNSARCEKINKFLQNLFCRDDDRGLG